MQQREIDAAAFAVVRNPPFSKRVLFVEALPSPFLRPIVSKSHISLQLSTKPQWEEQGEVKQAKLTFLISKYFIVLAICALSMAKKRRPAEVIIKYTEQTTNSQWG